MVVCYSPAKRTLRLFICWLETSYLRKCILRPWYFMLRCIYDVEGRTLSGSFWGVLKDHNSQVYLGRKWKFLLPYVCSNDRVSVDERTAVSTRNRMTMTYKRTLWSDMKVFGTKMEQSGKDQIWGVAPENIWNPALFIFEVRSLLEITPLKLVFPMLLGNIWY